MRIIPKKTKVDIEFFKGISLTDMAVGMFGAVILSAVFLSDFPFKWALFLAVLVIFTVLLVPIDEDKNYEFLLYIIRYFAHPGRVVQRPAEDGSEGDRPVARKQKKQIFMEDIMAFTGIEDGQICFGGEYRAAVIGISPIEFGYLSEARQDQMIERVFGAALRCVSGEGQSASLVKLDRPLIYDNTIQWEFDRMDQLKESYLNDVLSEEELTRRAEIIYDRIMEIETYNFDEKVYDSFHYLVLCDKSGQSLREMTGTVLNILENGDLPAKSLEDRELAVFLKYNFTREFDEREIEQIPREAYLDWIMPKTVEFTAKTVKLDGTVTHNLRVVSYPTEVGNAWGSTLFNLPDTRVVMKIRPMDRAKAIRSIDRSLDELRGQEGMTGKESRLMELAGHIDTLQQLLLLLQSDNELLYSVNIYMTLYDYTETARQLRPKDSEGRDLPRSDMKRRVKRTLAEQSFKTGDMPLRQFEMFVGSQVSRYDPFVKKGRGIHSSSVAAVFPFVYGHIFDESGFHIGNSSGIPVFVDFFVRNRDRINSNMVVIGKSGSGKSYATKMMLTNLAAENSKIFILDPENEYSGLAEHLMGNVIDVGSATKGRINPFHIITALEDEEGGSEGNVSFSVHLQFLEEYFKQILPGIDSDSLEYLNNMILRVYDARGIDAAANLGNLRPEDFPIFDDLFDKLLADYQAAASDYAKTRLRTLVNYISKFATGGRNAHLWNGPSTLDVKENFTVFNFQSLLANKNNTVANAQMLLILKWLDNEIIKNRDYNMKYHANRKIVVVIDEAHVFIDSKFPAALDFMFQLAKRIRKYNGMQVVITQNVKDFVGTEEIARKSTAIINASQYSFIFPMAPNDMHDLCRLYEKAGELNETEQEAIVNNGRGRAFVVTSPVNRTDIEITATPEIARLFE